MSYKGEYAVGDTIYILFTTRRFSTGAPFTLAGTPVLSVYEENNLTQITAGVSVSVDYDGVTGLNQATIVATGANGYEAGKNYDLVITTGTVDSVSVVGEVVGTFRMATSDPLVAVSDVHSLVTKVYSDTTKVETATDNGTLSDITSKLVVIDSGVNDAQSGVNDAQSGIDVVQTAVANGTLSDITSKLVVIDSGVNDAQSGVNDAQSGVDVVQTAVANGTLSDITSKLVVIGSGVDDAQSGINDAQSGVDDAQSGVNDAQSGVDVVQTAVANGTLSDITSKLVVIGSGVDDVQSGVNDAQSGVDHVQSKVIEIESDTASQATQITTIASDIVAIQDGYVESTTKAGTLSTTQCSTNLTEATDDHYIGRFIVFIDGPCAGQASDVTDYTGVNGVLTFTAMTEAAGAGNTFRLY